MGIVNLPIQAIVYFDAGGEPRPLRFRYEDVSHQIHTVRIDQMTDRRTLEYVGLETVACLCKGTQEGQEHIYELRYTLQTHKWVLFRQIY